MKEIKELIIEGRAEKTSGKAAEIFDKAFEIGNELRAQINPTVYLLKGLLWLLGVIIVSFIGRYITRLYFK